MKKHGRRVISGKRCPSVTRQGMFREKDQFPLSLHRVCQIFNDFQLFFPTIKAPYFWGQKRDMRATVDRSAKRSVNRPFHGRVLCGREPRDWVVDRGALRAGMRRMRQIVKDLPIRAADYLKRGIFDRIQPTRAPLSG